MPVRCPECNTMATMRDETCKKCGAELPAPPPPPAKKSDAAQYAMIGGAIVAVVALLLFLANASSTYTCRECKGKGVVVCDNCKGGRAKCIYCKGRGVDEQTQSTCLQCKGTGSTAVCPKCNGNPNQRCKSCGGTGSRSG